MDAAGRSAPRMSVQHDQARKGSAQLKHSSISEGAGKHSIVHVLSPPISQGSKTRIGGQLFLCIIGSVIGIAICIWLAFFSNDDNWRRVVFASGAAFCSLIFTLLGIKSLRAKPPEPEPLPDLSHRRSTIGGRTTKRSMSNTGSGNHADGEPTQVLAVDTHRASLLTPQG